MKIKRLLSAILVSTMLIGAVPVYADDQDNKIDTSSLSAEREITSEVDEERSALLSTKYSANIQTFDTNESYIEEIEPNDDLDLSNPLHDNDVYTGEVIDEDLDSFSFQLKVDSYVDIYLLAETYGCVAGLYDYNGDLLQPFDYGGTDDDGYHINTLQVKLPANTSENGYYYIAVYLDLSFDEYSTYAFHTLISPFLDVYGTDFFYDPVIWAVNNKITTGTREGYFDPEETCTRGQIVTFLWRAAGSPEPKITINPFTDIYESDYYYKAVLWAVEKDITTGTSQYKFSPNEGCTRGQVVTFLHRAGLTPKPASSSLSFKDIASSEYYYNAVLWAVNNNITNGLAVDRFGPDATCTRGQIVTFLYRGFDAIDWDSLNEYMTSKPIVPPPQHSEYYIEGVPVEDVITYFSEVCLDSEFTQNEYTSLVQKWTSPIAYTIIGNPTAKDLEKIKEFTQYLNTIPGFPGIYEAANPYQAVLDINFCTYLELIEILGDNFVNCDGGVRFWYDNNEIWNGTICYRTDIDQYVRNSVILEEIYNGLGPVQDTLLRPDSIIYQYYTTPQELTEIDELILELLYHPDIKCGMNEDQCAEVIRSLYY